MLSTLEDFIIWSKGVAISPWQTIFYMVLGLSLTYFLMLLVLDMFIPIGRILGRLMDEHPRTIWAYSVNVFGSLVGTWLFVLLSVFYQPPLTWFAVMGALVLLLFRETQSRLESKPRVINRNHRTFLGCRAGSRLFADYLVPLSKNW